MQVKNKRNSIKRNFSWNLLGSVIFAATQWLLIIVLTRLGSVEMVGYYTLGLAITSPLILFTNLQLRVLQATAKENEYRFEDLVATRNVTNLIFFTLLIIYLFIGNYDKYTFFIVLVTGLIKVSESFSELSYGLFHQQERMELIAKSTILRGCSSLIIVVTLLVLKLDLIYILFAIVLVNVIIFIFYDNKNLHLYGRKYKAYYSKSIYKIIYTALPLGLSLLLVSLNNNLPKIFVEKILDTKQLGFFASITYLVSIGSTLINSIGNALLPRMSKSIENRAYNSFKKQLYFLVLLSFIVGSVILIISYLFGEELLTIIYGEQFRAQKDVLVLIMLYGLLNYISYSMMVGLNSLKNFKVQPYIGVIWLTVLLYSLVKLLPEYGLMGAGLSLIIYALSRIVTIFFVLTVTFRKTKEGEKQNEG